jgi:DNA-binding transcriptional LysR family regulator
LAATLDDLVAMAVFARVVEARTFTAAAQKLGLSKSVISERVSQLEEKLGVRLLHRTTRRLSLTAEGQRLYEQCARLVESADDAIDVAGEVGAEPEGLVRVTTPLGFGLQYLAALLPEFLRAHPRVRVDLSLSDRVADVVGEGYDVAVRFATQLADSSMVAKKIGSDRWVVVASPAYLARAGTPTTPDDHADHDVLRLSVRGDVLGVRTTGSLVADNVMVLRAALLGGVGLAPLPRSVVADDLAKGVLIEVLADHPQPEMGVWVVCPHRRHQPARVRAFVDFLAAALAKPGWHG